jgi:hypothetical protein
LKLSYFTATIAGSLNGGIYNLTGELLRGFKAGAQQFDFTFWLELAPR